MKGDHEVPTFDPDSVPWRSLPCKKTELRIDLVLKCGQSFRWRPRDKKEGEFVGVHAGRAWILRQSDKAVEFKCFPEAEGKGDADDAGILEDYFQLRVELAPLYERWAEADENFMEISQRYQGIRILRQDPTENVFSFICSSNNNIQRISSMVEGLCGAYGRPICSFKGEEDSVFYSFPSVETLGSDKGLESRLRGMGFGYRAGYVAKAARQICQKGGEKYLERLRSMEYGEARKELLSLTGVGPKVSDCVLLMSLDKPSAVPVDTHMFQIAQKCYMPRLRSAKSVTDRVYAEIGDHFRRIHGAYAGWAHSVLFSADLRHLKSLGGGDNEGDKEDDEPVSKKIKKKSKAKA